MMLKSIAKQWLEKNGMDGLCNEDCGCKLDDLMPCVHPRDTCEAGNIRYGTFDKGMGLKSNWIIVPERKR